MALIDAGIPMKDIVAAVSCVINKDDQILLDPTLQEMENVKSVHTFAFNKTSSSLLFCESLGLFTDDQVSLVVSSNNKYMYYIKKKK
jgi:exosome complex component RRP46